MIVLDASVAVKWFVDSEPLAGEARAVLSDIEGAPGAFLVPELFMTELMAVLVRIGDGPRVHEALRLVEELGLTRIGNGRELLRSAATFACDWGLSGYDATYLALASLTGSRWLTADARAAKKVKKPSLVRVLGSGRR